MSDGVSDVLVRVATTYSVSEALVVRSMLQSYGVAASAFDLGMANVEPGLMIAIGGIRICVPTEDAALAHELLWTTHEERVPRRPYSRQAPLNALAAIGLALMGVPAPARVPLQR